MATATPDMLFPATACFVPKKGSDGHLPRHFRSVRRLYFSDWKSHSDSSRRTYDFTVLVIGADKLTSITN